MRNVAGLPQGTGAFKPVRIGAGGFCTGYSISNDAVTQATRIDVFGGYIKSTGDTVWRQAFTSATLAVGDCPGSTGYVAPTGGLVDNPGCFELIVAPNDNQRLYAVWNARTWKSINAGASWTHLTGVPDILAQSNSGGQPHNHGPNLAVDPQNHDVFLLGTQNNGLYWSSNGGTTITNVALGTNATFGGWQAPSKVACDPTGAIVSTVKQRWFATLQGTGVYVSTTGPGGTYTLMTGSPAHVGELVFDSAGNCWATDPTNTTTNNLWKCAAGGTTWANAPGSAPYMADLAVSVACDPTTAGYIVVLSDQGYAYHTTNAGTSWSGTQFNPTSYAYTVPWLGTGATASFGIGCARFDPVTTGKLHASNGVGTFHCSYASGAGAFVWTEDSEGIENMVANGVTEPVGGAPIFQVWDQGAWRMDNLGQSWRGYINRAPAGAFASSVQACWDVAVAADNQNWVAAMINFAGQWQGYSTDGWKTCQAFPTTPPNNGNGGCIAVGNAGNVIIVYSNNGQPVYTKNGGSTWTVLPFPGLPANGTANGFGWAYYNLTKYVTYNAHDAAFYLYNYGGTGTSAGVYKSTDQGDSWTQIFTGNIVSASDQYRGKLKSVPGQAGHLFFCDGIATTGNLKRSTNGGVTWSSVTGVTSVMDFAFGASATGQTYPAVYLWGTIGAVAGLYRSDDNFATTPKLLSSFPGNICDNVTCVGASPNIYGRVYVGFSGSSFVYGDYSFPLTLS